MGTGASRADDAQPIEVLECNWPAVQVYLASQWTLLLGFGASHYHGIATTELMAAMQVVGIPRRAWQDTLNRVRIMVRAARPLLNKTS